MLSGKVLIIHSIIGLIGKIYCNDEPVFSSTI